MPTFSTNFDFDFDVSCSVCGHDINETDVSEKRGAITLSVKCPNCIEYNEKEIELLTLEVEKLKEKIEALEIRNIFDAIQTGIYG